MQYSKPTTHQGNLAKLPLSPLVLLTERPQWCVWNWTQKPDGSWQKPPFQASDPSRHASSSDPSTWCSYEAALAVVQAGKADGISYVLTANDPFTAFDLDHCRHPDTHSIDVWAQNFLGRTRDSYGEVTPSGEGIRIWGLTGPTTAPVNRKFTLIDDGKPIAAEIFRRAPKILTVSGYRIDTVKVLTNVDRAVDWSLIWGERRKAAALEDAAAAQSNGHEFNANGGPGYDIELTERIVREGAPAVAGGNRSNLFHTVVGHYLGCGWGLDRIEDHLRQFPDGIGSKYIGEGRLKKEVERSAREYGKRELPVSEGWTPPERPAAKAPPPPADDPELDDDDGLAPGDPKPEPPPKPDPDPIEEDDPPELGDDDDDLDDDDPPELDDEPAPDPKLPKLYAHGDPDPRPLVSWMIKDLVPEVGHGLLVGQWGTGKTFVMGDLMASTATGQAFLGHPVRRQCGVLLIAAEGASQVRLRLEAVVREKCGNQERIPFRWYETTPMLLEKGSTKTLIAMAKAAHNSLMEEFGIPLGLIAIDTISACAGYTTAGGEYDSATGNALMGVLKAISLALNCFVLGVHHFGKDQEAGARGTIAFEDASDLLLACLGERSISGTVKNTRLTVRKNRHGPQGEVHPFTLRLAQMPEPDEDGAPVTTRVVDWQAAGATDAATAAADPWDKGTPGQRVAAQRLKQVMMSAMAKHGVEMQIPPDGPVVRMIKQKVVQDLFFEHSPIDDGDDKGHDSSVRKQFDRTRDRAELDQLIACHKIKGTVYLRLRGREENDREDDE